MVDLTLIPLNKKQKQDIAATLKSGGDSPLNQLTKKRDVEAAPKSMEDSPLKLDINKLNKEKEKKDATEAAGKRYCRVVSCLKEIYPNRKCPGHGGGGSDSEDEDENTENYETEASKNTSPEILTPKKPSLEEEVSGWGSMIRETEEEQLLFDLERMMQLLVFNNDSGKGILTLRVKPGQLLGNEKEIEAFFKAIEDAFKQFKSDLNKPELTKDFTCIVTKSELIIRIPVPKYYDDFIQELIVKKLWSSENTKQNNYLPNASPSPFAITPAPAMNKKEDLEEAQRSSLSPFSMELKPKSTIDL